MSEEVTTILENVRKALVALKGEDCYHNGILFRDGERDQEAMTWLQDSLSKLVERKRPNSDKAARVIIMLERILLHGYVDHFLMHRAKGIKEENEKLRATVDHLVTKLGNL